MTRPPGADARSWLFVPADRPRRFEKAATSGADEVVLDLEDSVLAPGKAEARRHVQWWLTHGGAAWVRINGATTEWYAQDVAMLSGCAGLRGFVVPKVEVAAALKQLGRRLGSGVSMLAMIESAEGLQRIHEICGVDELERLAFGSVDFADDIEAEHEWESLLYARSAIVVASRAAGKGRPLDGVTLQLGSGDAVRADAVRARRLGFGGKLCIHPEQVAAVTATFAPDDDAVVWAREVVAAFEASEAGVVRVGAEMVDRPVVERARRILAAQA